MTRESGTFLTVAGLMLFAGLASSARADEPKPLPVAKPQELATVTAYLKTQPRNFIFNGHTGSVMWLAFMPDGKTLDITIPPGIGDRQVLRLKGQGLPGSDGKPGDAYVEISVRPHPGFAREGDDILSTLPVSLGEALNGASVRVETVDGPVDVKVPKGAKDGTKLRLRGKGVSRGKAGGRGDQMVEIHIVPPEGADEALAQFMAEWEKTHPQNPRRKGAA